MKKAHLAVTFLLGLLSGTGAWTPDVQGADTRAGEKKPGSAPSAIFAGALSYDTPAPPNETVTGRDGFSQGDFSIDLYRGEFGPLGLVLDTGIARGDTNFVPDGFMVGLRFDYGGLSVASQWHGAEDGPCSLSESQCGTGPTWNIGASYSAGAASLSAQYRAVNPLGADDRGPAGDIFRLGFDYQIFDGFSSRADAYYIDGGRGLDTGESTVVLIGTRITF